MNKLKVLVLTLVLSSISSVCFATAGGSKRVPPIVDEDIVVTSSEVVTTEPEDESLLEKMMNLLSF